MRWTRSRSWHAWIRCEPPYALLRVHPDDNALKTMPWQWRVIETHLPPVSQVVAKMEKQNESLKASTPKHSAPVEAIDELGLLDDDSVGPPALYSPPTLSSPPSAEAALPQGGDDNMDTGASPQQPEPTFAVHKAVARHRTQPHAAEPPSTPKRSQSPRRAKRQQSSREADGGISEREVPTTQEGDAAYL